MEPDDDEDPTRTCLKCGKRPRWSHHGACKHCVECATKVAFCIRVRKEEGPFRHKGIPEARRPEQYRQRMARYHALRKLAMPASMAREGMSSEAASLRAIENWKKLLPEA
jgi:hypothetical protein